METRRIQTAFRLRADLLKRLKVAAKRENRSLNNYVESVQMKAVYIEPNSESESAIAEAGSGKALEKIDVDKFEEFVSKL
mgnify:CR=1 FL=1|jgi:hypothetical protein